LSARIAAFMIDIVFISSILLLTQMLSEAMRWDLLANDYCWPGVFVFIWFYFAGMEGSRAQATFGKWCLGLKIYTYEGFPPSFFRSSLRLASLLPTALTAFIGFFSASCCKHKQCLHDLIARTVVLNIDK
ncbi:MAG: RDD family protein, partial [Chlamydiia bacterium]|nr:RDD family protein [Chlamydiia bacterium]